jgi:predicted RND superfamily exporter protein
MTVDLYKVDLLRERREQLGLPEPKQVDPRALLRKGFFIGGLLLGAVLGLMGWARIPLDLMTVTIAAITIGIGVDNTIHYVHRYQEEIKLDGDAWAAIARCHGSIGRALYYTMVTIVLGFSVLALSAFIPTIMFGLLTGLAMTAALVANMTLLPVLLARTERRPG